MSRIELALADIEGQKKPNYAAIARKHEVDPTTLMRRHKGQTVSRATVISEIHQRLTVQQEEVLIMHINKLTDRGIPPTSRIVRNMTEEMIGESVGKNWTGRFVQRHQDRLKSLYLRNIDNVRKKAEYKPSFKMFYELVSILQIYDCTNYTQTNGFDYSSRMRWKNTTSPARIYTIGMRRDSLLVKHMPQNVS